MEPTKKNRMDRLERGLYSRKHPSEFNDERSEISHPEFDVHRDWQQGDEDLEELIKAERNQKEENQGALFKKILIGSVIFFVLAVGAAAFLFFGGANFISGNNIDIQVQGPTTIGAGEELSLDVIVKNNNAADLQNANLTLEYPDGTRVAGQLNTTLARDVETIDTVPAHGQIDKTLNSVLFGEKDAVLTIKMTLQYGVKGSNATFLKEKDYQISISSAPVIVTITNPAEVNSNQLVEFDIDVASNNADTLNNVLLTAEYPFGFTFQDSDPKPLVGNNVWQIGDLRTAEKQTIHIRGVLQGQDQEQRTFRFSTGIADPQKTGVLGAVFSVLSQTVTIKKPFIGVDVAVGGSTSGEYVAQPGEKVQTNIDLTNNLPTQLLDAKVVASLSGAALDQSSVSVSDGGFYKSLDNTITWDKTSTPDLASISPGSDKVISFLFAPLISSVAGSSNQQIDIQVTVTGNQIDNTGTPEAVSTTQNETVKLASNVNLGARLVRSVGPFENSGPIPPIANKETTYTVTWSLTNSLNTVSQTKVTTQLPPYVKWTGLTDPSSETISYDPLTSTVTWDAGDLQAGTGSASAPREASFQIDFTPSLSQTGNSPTLIPNSILSGVDRFTGSTVSVSAPALTTRFSSDPGFRNGDEVVGQ